MNDLFLNPLASNASRRQVSMLESSGGKIGLSVSDILKHGIVGRGESSTRQVVISSPSLGEQMFQALADAKIWTSKVAMHLELTARDRFFRQLDLLHDCDEWFVGDQPVLLESYKAFIRFMLAAGGQSKPSLALSPIGNLVAVWMTSDDRLTVEFIGKDRVDWVVSRRDGERVERAAGTTTLARLPDNLAPYNSQTWLGAE